MKGWVIGLALVVFFLAGSDFLEPICYSSTTRPVHSLLLVDAALAGGGFGVPKKRGGDSVGGGSRIQPHTNKKTPTSLKKKRKGSWIADVVPQSRTRDDNNNDPSTPELDKWGLPPPTVEDIFPLMPPGTELIPAESSKDYSLAEIQQALQHHIPLAKLALRFDEHGVERRTAASSTVDRRNNAEQQQQQERQPSMKLRLLHQSPPVLAIDHFLTPQECREIYQIAMPNNNDMETETTSSLSPTTTTTVPPLPAVQVESKTFSVLAQSRRTSTSWFCYYESLPTLLAKTRDVLGIVETLDQIEEPQIVRYQSGQEFSWHYDEVPTPQLDNGGPRLATLLVYLNTVPESGGGGTVFRDLRDCHGHSLTVQPVQGTALLFFPAFANGRSDDRTLHRGEPILGDDADTDTIVEKRIVQLWIHSDSYRAAVPPHNRQQDAVAAVDQVSQRLGYPTTTSSSTGPRTDGM